MSLILKRYVALLKSSYNWLVLPLQYLRFDVADKSWYGASPSQKKDVV